MLASIKNTDIKHICVLKNGVSQILDIIHFSDSVKVIEELYIEAGFTNIFYPMRSSFSG